MVWRQAGFLANLPTHATRASRSPRFRPCSLKYTQQAAISQKEIVFRFRKNVQPEKGWGLLSFA